MTTLPAGRNGHRSKVPKEQSKSDNRTPKGRAGRGQDEQTELRDGGITGRARRPLAELIVRQGNCAWEKNAYAMWGDHVAANA